MRRRAPTDIHLPLLDDRPREECGIVGICGVENASELAFLALYALQHRGQEAAGICAASNGRTRVYKELGLVSDVFDAKRIASLPGNTALGHVRYSTAGGGQRVNAQPIVVRYAEGDLAIVHNGNLTNARMVKRQLVREGAIFQSTSDSEVIVHLVARSRHRMVQAQLRDALSFLEGAYSLVLTVGETMYAVRDPRGFRPLVMGELDGGHIVTSETCALDLMGATYVRGHRAGRTGSLPRRRGRKPPRSAPADPRALHLRACLFRAARFQPVGNQRGPRPARLRAAACARAPGHGRLRDRRAGQRQLGGARVQRAERDSLRTRPAAQPLRGTHLHPAVAGRSRLRGAGEVQPRARGAGGPARGRGGRLDRAGHDFDQPGQVHPRGERGRGALPGRQSRRCGTPATTGSTCRRRKS